ncbi:MAG: universal stress protein [Nitrospira sp. LK70]|nr:universal stress protein [Nitrospira sp. LK70]
MGDEEPVIKRILFATDFSSCAHHAEAYAAFLANAYEATVTILHVLEIYEGTYVTTVQDPNETQEQLDEIVRRLAQPAGRVKHQQRAGIPDTIICETAQEVRADLIVLGTHGRTGLRHVLLGSTAERVLTMASCPVLTIRKLEQLEGHVATKPIHFKQIAVPIDFSDCSLEAVEYGVQIAKNFDASLTLLHSLEPLSYGIDLTFGHAAEQNRQQIVTRLKLVADEVQSQGVSVRTVIRGGMPADSILDFIDSSDCDLVVMGTHGRRGLSHLVKGSVAEAVLRRASCPVLAARHFTQPRSGRLSVAAS